MPDLLDLPLEIRLMILEYVIYAEKDPPLEFSEEGKASRTQMVEKKVMDGWGFGRRIYYETDLASYRPSASNILAVNQQLRQEIKAFMERGPLVYKLDLAIMQGMTMWPTWTSLPIRCSTIDVVEVKTRAAGPELPCVDILRRRDGGPPDWIWWFYTMVEHFFTIGVVPHQVKYGTGASSFRIKNDRKQKIAVKVLDIDIVDPLVFYGEELEADADSSQRYRVGDQDVSTPICSHCLKPCRRLRGPKTSPWRLNFGTDALHDDIMRNLFILLNPRLSNRGDVLYRDVEIVRIRCRGELKHEVVLVEYLMDSLSKFPRNVIESSFNETLAICESSGLDNLGMEAGHNRNIYAPDSDDMREGASYNRNTNSASSSTNDHSANVPSKAAGNWFARLLKWGRIIRTKRKKVSSA